MGKHSKKKRDRSYSRSESSYSRSRSDSRSRRKHKKDYESSKKHKHDKSRDHKSRDYDRDRRRRSSSRDRNRRNRSDSRSRKRNYDRDRRENSRDRRRRNDDRRDKKEYKSKDQRRRSRSKDSRKRKDRSPSSDMEFPFERKDRNKENDEEEKSAEVSPEKPCFIPSGILAKYSNAVNGVVLKFTEPIDSAQPDKQWRIFQFKGQEELPTLHLHRQASFLFGKDDRIADIVLENPTCSSQHCVIQFREIKKQDPMRGTIKSIKPYLMDLESTNGTFLNGDKIEPARYYQLIHEDVIKLGHSSRDYVIMCDQQNLEDEE